MKQWPTAGTWRPVCTTSIIVLVVVGSCVYYFTGDGVYIFLVRRGDRHGTLNFTPPLLTLPGMILNVMNNTTKTTEAYVNNSVVDVQ